MASGDQNSRRARDEFPKLPFCDAADAAELQSAAESFTSKRPMHIFVHAVDIAVLSHLRALCFANKVYSIHVTEATFDVLVFANEFDAIPIFEAATANVAVTTAMQLIEDPYRIVESAINGAAVLDSYGRGRPT